MISLPAIDPKRRVFLAHRNMEMIEQDENFERLLILLRTAAKGSEVALAPDGPEQLAWLVSHGRSLRIPPHTVVKLPGKLHRCHQNTVHHFELNRRWYFPWTGYALWSDGVWRQHSWLLHRGLQRKQIGETTIPALMYWGARLTGTQQLLFCLGNKTDASWREAERA